MSLDEAGCRKYSIQPGRVRSGCKILSMKCCTVVEICYIAIKYSNVNRVKLTSPI